MECKISKSLFKAFGVTHYYDLPYYLPVTDQNSSIEKIQSTNMK